MEKMKAFVKQNKESNDFTLMDISIPTINDDGVLVKVKAIGVGIQDGYFFPGNIEFPYNMDVREELIDVMNKIVEKK